MYKHSRSRMVANPCLNMLGKSGVFIFCLNFQDHVRLLFVDCKVGRTANFSLRRAKAVESVEGFTHANMSIALPFLARSKQLTNFHSISPDYILRNTRPMASLANFKIPRVDNESMVGAISGLFCLYSSSMS
jgi:hypothetical protein